MEQSTERTATVKVLALQGKGNKIYRPGDKVNPSNFPEGNFDKLIESGHIIPAKEVKAEVTIQSEKEKAKKAAEKQAAEDRSAAVTKASELGVDVTDDMTTDDITEAIEAKEAALEAEKEAAQALEYARQKCNKYDIEFKETDDIEMLNALIEEYIAAHSKKFTDAENNERIVIDIEDITKPELVIELEKAKATFNKNASKAVLFGQWMDIK